MSRAPRRPALPDVTLLAVTSVALQPTMDALHRSMEQADFGKVLLLSDRAPPELSEQIEWRRIDRLESRVDYSRFMLRGLAEHVETRHALCVQWDGFVLDGTAWDPQFLNYDYIGAVWPHFDDLHNVGNGGFSLRSRRLLDACTTLPFDELHSEDVVISRLCRRLLEERGIGFAPVAVAKKFAYERAAPSGREFGFHGAFNLVRYLSRKEALQLFQDLESDMLAQNERVELLSWALKRGRIMLARAMLARIFG